MQKNGMSAKTQTPRQHILLRPYAKTLGISQINRGWVNRRGRSLSRKRVSFPQWRGSKGVGHPESFEGLKCPTIPIDFYSSRITIGTKISNSVSGDGVPVGVGVKVGGVVGVSVVVVGVGVGDAVGVGDPVGVGVGVPVGVEVNVDVPVGVGVTIGGTEQ